MRAGLLGALRGCSPKKRWRLGGGWWQWGVQRRWGWEMGGGDIHGERTEVNCAFIYSNTHTEQRASDTSKKLVTSEIAGVARRRWWDLGQAGVAGKTTLQSYKISRCVGSEKGKSVGLRAPVGIWIETGDWGQHQISEREVWSDSPGPVAEAKPKHTAWQSTLLPAASLPTADSASQSQYPFPSLWEVPTNRVEWIHKWNTLAIAGQAGIHQGTLRPLWTFADLHWAPWSSEALWEVDGAGISITPTSQKGKLGSRVTWLIKDRSGLKLRSISNASFFSFMGIDAQNKEDYWINNFYCGKIYITWTLPFNYFKCTVLWF